MILLFFKREDLRISWLKRCSEFRMVFDLWWFENMEIDPSGLDLNDKGIHDAIGAPVSIAINQ